MIQVRCSFCNKTQNQVRKLIAGPNGAYICDECVDVCAEIIEEEFEYEDGREWNPVLGYQSFKTGRDQSISG